MTPMQPWAVLTPTAIHPAMSSSSSVQQELQIQRTCQASWVWMHLLPEVVHVDAGDFSAGQRRQLQEAVDLARQICGLAFGIRIGPLPAGRQSAIAAHAGMSGASRAVLVAVDPGSRSVEIVTGTEAKVSLDDGACELSVLSIITGCEAGDVIGGVRSGLILLAEHARSPQVMFLDEPA